MSVKNMVFIHGSGMDNTTLKAVAEVVKKENKEIKVHLIDLPGHGNDKGNIDINDLTFETYINYVEGIIESLEDVLIVGHSLGGTIVLKVLSDNLLNVVGGVTLCSAPSYELDREFVSKLTNGILDMDYLTNSAGNLDNNDVVEALKCVDEQLIIHDLLLCTAVNITNCLNNIKVPLLTVCGEEDRLAPKESSEKICNIVKNSTLLSLKEKHMSPIANKQVVADKIIELFK